MGMLGSGLSAGIDDAGGGRFDVGAGGFAEILPAFGEGLVKGGRGVEDEGAEMFAGGDGEMGGDVGGLVVFIEEDGGVAGREIGVVEAAFGVEIVGCDRDAAVDDRAGLEIFVGAIGRERGARDDAVDGGEGDEGGGR